MPDGMVWWFDPSDGEGRIRHAGRTYVVRSEDMEPEARVAGARVHFDVDRHAPGTASRVSLRPGKRVSRRQRRFGDLTGARRADTKGPAAPGVDRPELGRDLETHPKRVVESWASMLSEGRLDDAMLLFAPNAVLHAEGEIWVGARQVRSFWERSPLRGGPTPVDIHGEHGVDGEVFVVRWPTTEVTGQELETRSTVTHGEIRDQRHGTVTSVVPDGPAETPVDISTEGDVSEADRAHAVRMIGAVTEVLGAPVLHVSVRLRHAADPSQEHPAKARAMIDVDGDPVRAHASGSTVTEAIDRLGHRLRDRFEHVAAHRRAMRRRGPTSPPGEWRHGDLEAQRPPYFPRPVEDRAVVRHKSASPVEATLDEAVFDLEAMDHDFLLFQDIATGADAVLSRNEGGSYSVQYVEPPTDETSGPEVAAAIEVDPRPLSELTVDAACDLLDLSGVPWLFFKNIENDRGEVLYRRYDGHYGLVVPADEV